MKRFVQCLLGLNLASVIRGLRFGPGAFWEACHAALCAVFPLQKRADFTQAEALRRIPQASLEEILGENTIEIKLTVQRYENGMLPVHEAQALLSILVMESPKEVLEIGTFMAHNPENGRKPKRFYGPYG